MRIDTTKLFFGICFTCLTLAYFMCLYINWDKISSYYNYQTICILLAILPYPAYKLLLSIITTMQKKHPMYAITSVLIGSMLIIVLLLFENNIDFVSRIIFWFIFAKLLICTLWINTSKYANKIKLIAQQSDIIETRPTLTIQTENPDSDSNSNLLNKTTSTAKNREEAQDIKEVTRTIEEIQEIYEKAIELEIIKCSSPNVLNKIAQGIPLEKDEYMKFIYKPQGAKNPTNRDLIRFFLILLDDTIIDKYKPSNNDKIIQSILNNGILINGTIPDKSSINSSAVNKARQNIDRSKLYTLLRDTKTGQS